MLRVGSFVSVAKRDTADACTAAKAPSVYYLVGADEQHSGYFKAPAPRFSD
jgi:hypothetical protein